MDAVIVSHSFEIRGHPVRDVTICGKRFREWNGYVFHRVAYWGSKTGKKVEAFELAFDEPTQDLVAAALEVAQ